MIPIEIDNLDVVSLKRMVMSLIEQHSTWAMIANAEVEGLKNENRALKEALGNQIIGIILKNNYREVNVKPEESGSSEEAETGGQEEEKPTIVIDRPQKGYPA